MQIFLVLFLMIDKTVITTCNRGNQCVSHVLGHVRTSGPTLHSCKKIPECITSFDRTDLANVIILQLSFCCPSFVATFGVTHPSCNPYCWPGPSGRWGVRWVWLASTTWEWWGSKGRGGHPVSDGPWRGTQWRACPLARSITTLFLSAQPEALPSTCLLLHGPKSGRVTWGVISTGIHQLHGFTTAGAYENRRPRTNPAELRVWLMLRLGIPLTRISTRLYFPGSAPSFWRKYVRK